jgi:hypothetical protein
MPALELGLSLPKYEQYKWYGSEDFWFAGPGVATAPVVTVITGPSRSKISRQAGADSSDLTFESDIGFVEYQVKVVPSSDSPVTAGTLVESATGNWAGGQDVTITVTDDEFVAASASEGNNVVKIFAKNSAGVWST